MTLTAGTTVTVLAVALLAAGCSSDSAPSTDLTVLAASSLTDVYDELAQAFEAAHPDIDVDLQFAGSSRLASLIEEGAPGHVFASADRRTMQRVVDRGEAATDPRPFATNALTLIVPSGNPADVSALGDLARPELLVAQCAVQVPCGAAAAELYASIDLVVEADSFEPNVRAVVTKVELGEVDVGVVYRTDALAASDRVTEVSIDASWVVNEYSVVTLAGAPAEADRLVAFVLSPEGQAILAGHGFGAP